jgi:hypothetical protein
MHLTLTAEYLHTVQLAAEFFRNHLNIVPERPPRLAAVFQFPDELVDSIENIISQMFSYVYRTLDAERSQDTSLRGNLNIAGRLHTVWYEPPNVMFEPPVIRYRLQIGLCAAEDLTDFEWEGIHHTLRHQTQLVNKHYKTWEIEVTGGDTLRVIRQFTRNNFHLIARSSDLTVNVFHGDTCVATIERVRDLLIVKASGEPLPMPAVPTLTTCNTKRATAAFARIMKARFERITHQNAFIKRRAKRHELKFPGLQCSVGNPQVVVNTQEFAGATLWAPGGCNGCHLSRTAANLLNVFSGNKEATADMQKSCEVFRGWRIGPKGLVVGDIVVPLMEQREPVPAHRIGRRVFDMERAFAVEDL